MDEKRHSKKGRFMNSREREPSVEARKGEGATGRPN
jgi:hypothetical protein